MAMRTYDEMIAGLGNMGETLMHFNEKHDSKGRFAKKSGSLSDASWKASDSLPKGMASDTFLSMYGMDSRKIPKDTYEYKQSGNVKFVDGGRQKIISNMAKSLLTQSSKTGYGNNLLAGVNSHTDDPYRNTMVMRRALHAELKSAYLKNVTDPDLLPQNSEDEYKLDQMIWSIGNDELEKEINKQGMSNAPNEIAVARAKASRIEGKQGAKITMQDRINAANKQASNAQANSPKAMVLTAKGKISQLSEKAISTGKQFLNSSANAAKSASQTAMSKGKEFLNKVFK